MVQKSVAWRAVRLMMILPTYLFFREFPSASTGIKTSPAHDFGNIRGRTSVDFDPQVGKFFLGRKIPTIFFFFVCRVGVGEGFWTQPPNPTKQHPTPPTPLWVFFACVGGNVLRVFVFFVFF